MNTYLNSDRLLDNSVGGGKIVDKSIEVGKLTEEIGKNISDSKTVADTLLQAFTEAKGNPSHVVDPFVRAGLIPIPFEDAEVKRILVEKYDTDGDGELYYKDVQKIKTLGYDGIFAGNTKIKHFRELRSFSSTVTLNRNTAEEGTFQDCTNLVDVEFPEGFDGLNHQTFKNCTSLALDSLPDSITNMGVKEFENCSSLKLTKLPDNLKSMGWYCFSGCSNCEFKETPVGLTRIPEGWANGTKNRTIDILSPNVSQLDWNSLGTFTQWVAFHATTPPTCTSAAFYAKATIYVPDEAVDTYKNATGFKDVADRIKPLSEKPAN